MANRNISITRDAWDRMAVENLDELGVLPYWNTH